MIHTVNRKFYLPLASLLFISWLFASSALADANFDLNGDWLLDEKSSAKFEKQLKKAQRKLKRQKRKIELSDTEKKFDKPLKKKPSNTRGDKRPHWQTAPFDVVQLTVKASNNGINVIPIKGQPVTLTTTTQSQVSLKAMSQAPQTHTHYIAWEGQSFILERYFNNGASIIEVWQVEEDGLLHRHIDIKLSSTSKKVSGTLIYQRNVPNRND